MVGWVLPYRIVSVVSFGRVTPRHAAGLTLGTEPSVARRPHQQHRLEITSGVDFGGQMCRSSTDPK